MRTIPEKDLVKLLGEGGEESGQRQDEASQDGRQPGRLATTQGHHQRCPQPAPAQLDHAYPHWTDRKKKNKFPAVRYVSYNKLDRAMNDMEEK